MTIAGTRADYANLGLLIGLSFVAINIDFAHVSLVDCEAHRGAGETKEVHCRTVVRWV